MTMSWADLDRKIEEAIEANPALRNVQFQTRVSLAIAQALAELFHHESVDSVADKTQMDPARLQSICRADPKVDITVVELARIGIALGYQFSFYFDPLDPNTPSSTLDDQRAFVRGVLARMRGRVGETSLWSLKGDETSS